MEVVKLAVSPYRIPIFPLGVVLLPEMHMPLHIFEERYKTMVHECLERNEPFGIVFFDGEKIHNVGCTARIVEILKQYEDGRMDIMVQGERRFYMDQTDDSRPYLISEIIYIEDMKEIFNDQDRILTDKITDLLSLLSRLSGTAEENRKEGNNPLKLSFQLPAIEGFTPQERQRFLEMTSPRERLTKGLSVLEKVIARAKLNLEVAKIIGGNGHIQAFLAQQGFVS